MEKITLIFSARHCFDFCLNPLAVILTLDENGKNCSLDFQNPNTEMETLIEDEEGEPLILPKRVMNAFTERVINKILVEDEIPNKSGMMVLDGFTYEITISKGNLTKEYYANDANIETYPVLRYLASWYRTNLYIER